MAPQINPPKTDYTDLGKATPNILHWNTDQQVTVTGSPNPNWKYGEGTTSAEYLEQEHMEVDPVAEGRPMSHNYRLLISSIVPRPIGFISTVSSDGVRNLASFSYFQCVDHDPPVFVVGFSGRAARLKYTLTNLEATRECTINVVSEHMIEAVNA